MDFHSSARMTGIAERRRRSCDRACARRAGDEDGKCLYLGPDRAGNLLEVVSVLREDGSVIHAMRMRRIYEACLPDVKEADD